MAPAAFIGEVADPSRTLLTELKFDTVPLYQEVRIELDGQATVPAR